jgi:branched-chain amino acid transport system substrate-binding protein
MLCRYAHLARLVNWPTEENTMEPTPFRRFLALFAVCALLLAACGGQDDEVADEPVDDPAEEPEEDEPADDQDGAEPEGDPIRIGASLGLTGAFAGPSEHYRILYQAAAAEINDQGGILGRPVELLLYDDESTQATAQTLYERLISEDEVDLLLAPYTTFIGGAVIPVVRNSGLLMVNAGFTGWELARQYDKLFMVWPMQEPTWAQGFFELLGDLPEDERPARMALVTAQNPFTVMVRDGFEGELGVLNWADELGIEVVVNEEYPQDAADVSGLVQRAQDADADLFVVLGLPDDSGLIARTVAEVGYQPDIYCSCGSSVTTFPFWKDIGEAGNYVFTPVPAWETDEVQQFPGIDEVVRIFDEEGFEEMPAYGPVAYAALQIMQQAVEETGSTDGDVLAEYLHEHEFQTATGTLRFDEHGVPEFAAGVVQFVDGSNVMVWPPDRSTADPVIPRP